MTLLAVFQQLLMLLVGELNPFFHVNHISGKGGSGKSNNSNQSNNDLLHVLVPPEDNFVRKYYAILPAVNKNSVYSDLMPVGWQSPSV